MAESDKSFQDLVDSLSCADKAVLIHVVEVHDKFCLECKTKTKAHSETQEISTNEDGNIKKSNVSSDLKKDCKSIAGWGETTETSIIKTIGNNHLSKEIGEESLTEKNTINKVEDIEEKVNPIEEDTTAKSKKKSKTDSNKTDDRSKTMKWAIQLFKKWLKEKGTNYNFEWMPTEEIAEHIRNMAMEKTKNFKPVFPHHIIDIIRLSVVDYLNHKPFKRGLGLPFKKTSSVTPIELVDLKKIYSSGIFGNGGTYTALSLLYKVWFEINLHFGHFLKKNCSRLRKEELKIATDEKGRLFCTFCLNEMDDTRWKDAPRIYSTPENLLCPLKSVLCYITHLNPDSEFLFQHPLRYLKKDAKLWYSSTPLSRSSMKKMMRVISKTANLSNEYTNISICDTSLVILTQADLWNEEEYKKRWTKENNYDIAERKGNIFMAIQKYIHGPAVSIGNSGTFLPSKETGPPVPTSVRSSLIQFKCRPLSTVNEGNINSKEKGDSCIEQCPVKKSVLDLENVCPQRTQAVNMQQQLPKSDCTPKRKDTNKETGDSELKLQPNSGNKLLSNKNQTFDESEHNKIKYTTRKDEQNILNKTIPNSSICLKEIQKAKNSDIEIKQDMVYHLPKPSEQAHSISCEVTKVVLDTNQNEKFVNIHQFAQVPLQNMQGIQQNLTMPIQSAVTSVKNPVQFITMPGVQWQYPAHEHFQNHTRKVQISEKEYDIHNLKRNENWKFKRTNAHASKEVEISTVPTCSGKEVISAIENQSLSSDKMSHNQWVSGETIDKSSNEVTPLTLSHLFDIKVSNIPSIGSNARKFVPVGQNSEATTKKGSSNNLKHDMKIPSDNYCTLLPQTSSGSEKLIEQYLQAGSNTVKNGCQEKQQSIMKVNNAVIAIAPPSTVQEFSNCKPGNSLKDHQASLKKSRTQNDSMLVTDVVFDENRKAWIMSMKPIIQNNDPKCLVQPKDKEYHLKEQSSYRKHISENIGKAKHDNSGSIREKCSKIISSECYEPDEDNVTREKTVKKDLDQPSCNFTITDVKSINDLSNNQYCKTHLEIKVEPLDTSLDGNNYTKSGSVLQKDYQYHKQDVHPNHDGTELVINNDFKDASLLNSTFQVNKVEAFPSFQKKFLQRKGKIAQILKKIQDDSKRLENFRCLKQNKQKYPCKKTEVEISTLEDTCKPGQQNSKKYFFDGCDNYLDFSTASVDKKSDGMDILTNDNGSRMQTTPLKLSIRKKDGNQYEIVKSNVSRQIIYAPSFEEDPNDVNTHTSHSKEISTIDKQRKRKLDCCTMYDGKSGGLLPCLLPLKKRCVIHQHETSNGSLNSTVTEGEHLFDYVLSEKESDLESDCSLTDEPSLLKCVNTRFYNFNDIDSD